MYVRTYVRTNVLVHDVQQRRVIRNAEPSDADGGGLLGLKAAWDMLCVYICTDHQASDSANL